jgi:hypothetical protein
MNGKRVKYLEEDSNEVFEGTITEFVWTEHLET